MTITSAKAGFALGLASKPSTELDNVQLGVRCRVNTRRQNAVALTLGDNTGGSVQADVDEEQPFPGLGVGGWMLRVFAWAAKAKFTHGALVIVQDENERLLLVQERVRERLGWGFPGGFMKLSEMPDQAAVRKLGKETGVRAQVNDLKLVAEYRQSWAWHYDHLFYLSVNSADISIVKPKLDIKSIDWFDRGELPVILTQAAYFAITKWNWRRL